MLLATYQPMFRAACHPVLKAIVTELAKTINEELNEDFRGESDPDFRDFLGFDPIWCFPAENFKTAFTHSMLTAPNTMDIFFILETEKFVRIDKVKHYQAIQDGLSGINCIKSAISPNCPDYRSEFLVPIEILPDMKLAFLVRSMEFLADGMTELLPVVCQSTTIDIPRLLLKMCMPTVVQVAQRFTKQICFPNDVQISDSDVAYRIQAECDRILFSFFLLPVIYRCLNLEDCNTGDLLSCSLARDKATRLFTAMGRWSYGDCNPNEYDRLFNEMSACVIDSREFLEYFFEHGMPGRNDMCPCNSGKKFKKCCGRML